MIILQKVAHGAIYPGVEGHVMCVCVCADTVSTLSNTHISLHLVIGEMDRTEVDRRHRKKSLLSLVRC